MEMLYCLALNSHYKKLKISCENCHFKTLGADELTQLCLQVRDVVEGV